ncbi:hypothetical protein V6N13_019646 [Hibiscus sabdariffa]|uniref:Uncharacterized protein n=1 Tax=Hibiscus sabdariffa TaxID=183260 RepID=A0ABR2ELI6_9ROSI
MNSDIKQWVQDNLMQQLRFGRESQGWDLIFGATCWYLWFYQNGLVYGTDGVETWSVLAKVRGWCDAASSGCYCERLCWLGFVSRCAEQSCSLVSTIRGVVEVEY